MESAMELRHLRYFIAVAEEGSLTLAAEKRLHTAQPSLNRQMRDLEYEVGVQLMTRSVHGIELTAAGRAFLDHALCRRSCCGRRLFWRWVLKRPFASCGVALPQRAFIFKRIERVNDAKVPPTAR